MQKGQDAAALGLLLLLDVLVVQVVRHLYQVYAVVPDQQLVQQLEVRVLRVENVADPPSEPPTQLLSLPPTVQR